MNLSALLYHLLSLVFLVLFFITITASLSAIETVEESSSFCKFERFAEVKKECSSILSSASELKLDNKRTYGIERDLSFYDGDWVQEPGGAPLMPFDDSDMPINFPGASSLLKLASFWVENVDFTHQFENAISVCGLLSLGITRNRTLSHAVEHWPPWFSSLPGISYMQIPFEGLYVETEENRGERVMCLLGTALFPFSKGLVDHWELSVDNGCKHSQQLSPSLQDDRILLILRYPKSFTLTSRAIHGEMRNLNQKSNPMYFDKVHISSQMGYDSNYQFVSEKLVSKACELYPHNDVPINGGIHMFKNFQFCKVFQMFDAEVFDIVANSECHRRTNESCNSLGPFVLESGTKVINTTFNYFRLIMNDLRCVPGDDINRVKTAKVSTVFRAVSPWENKNTAKERTGLSGMTISAEGIWNSSSGQLCMVGCVGPVYFGSDGCESRICLYFPITFSIIQRSIIVGTISSIKTTDSYTPLMFKKVLHPSNFGNRYSEYAKSYLSYKYSKIELATALWQRNENSHLETLMNKLFLKYPSVEDNSNLTSLSYLLDDLYFSVDALPDPLPNPHPPKTFVTMEVLSLGPLFGHYWSKVKQSCHKEETEFNYKFESDKKNPLLNISAHLSLNGNSYSHIQTLFVEGVYNSLAGKMYLVGCRDVPLEFQRLGNMNLENGMDCLIDVKVEYSSKTIRWFRNPTAKVSITSQRNEKDPLHFSRISFKTSLISSTDNSKDIIFSAKFEEIFRILVLLASVACILGQLVYVRKKADVIPFVSLVMLGAQALGHCLPLITGSAILIKWKEFQYRGNRSYDIGSMPSQLLLCAMKFLLLVIFVLTLRLYQKVWKSRNKQITNKPLKQNPSDKLVFLATLTTHMIGFLVVHIFHSVKAEDSVNLHRGSNSKLPLWVTTLDEYMGLVQDFFLLPQVIGNVIWKIQVKPLRKGYFIGFTTLRFLARAYYYLRDPIFSSYLPRSEFYRSTEFFTKLEDFVIMMTMVVLAIIVYAQQRWKINNPALLGSDLYEDLLSK